MIRKYLDGGTTEADGTASAPVGPSVATSLGTITRQPPTLALFCISNYLGASSSMVVFFIQELLILIYVVLMICSPKLNCHVRLFFNHSHTVEMLQLWDWFVDC